MAHKALMAHTFFRGLARFCAPSPASGENSLGEIRNRCDDEEQSAVWLPNKSSSPIDAAQKPYYCGSKNSHFRAVMPRLALLGRAPARSARASAANHRESISACQNDDSVIANSNVTSKVTDQAFPQYSCAPRGRLRRAEITAQTGCAQCVLLIEQF
jgi:hypothetical protein